MLWGSNWNIAAHAGFSPLCLCCCDMEEEVNQGGAWFPDSTVVFGPARSQFKPTIKREGINPFLRVNMSPVSAVDIVPDPVESALLPSRQKLTEPRYTGDKAQRSAGLRKMMAGLSEPEQKVMATKILAEQGIELQLPDEGRMPKDCFCELLLLLIAADEI